MEKTKEQEQAEMKAAVAQKAKERAPKVPATQMVGWSDADCAVLGDQLARLEPAVLQLQRQEGIRIRCAGGKKPTVCILDLAGQPIPQDAPTREWGVAKAALLEAGFAVEEDGSLVAAATPAGEAKTTGRRGRGAATEG